MTLGSTGSVRVTGQSKLLRTSTAKGGPGKVSVRLRLTRRAVRTLHRAHRLRLAVKVRFAPTGGTPTVRGTTIVLH